MADFNPDDYLKKEEPAADSKDQGGGFDPNTYVKKKEEPVSGAQSVSGKAGSVTPEPDPTLPSGSIYLDTSKVGKTAKDEEIYEKYSTIDDTGNQVLDINTLVSRYNDVVTKNIPQDAELRTPTAEEFKSLSGEGIPIDEMIINSNKPVSPSSSFEYILGKGASQSLLFKSLLFLNDAGNSYSNTPFQDAYSKMQIRSNELTDYYNNYDANAIEDATAFALGMFLDTPLFGGAGQVGKMGYKSALNGYNTIQSRLLMRGVEREVVERAMASSAERLMAKKGVQYGMTAVGGGTALGTYSFIGDVANQVESGKDIEDLDWENSLKEGGKSFLIGSALGLSSQAFGELSYKTTGQIKNTFNRRMAQTGLRTADFAVENVIFLYGSAALDKDVSFSDITWEDASKMALELGALKLSGALQANVKGLSKSKNFTKEKINKEEFKIEFDDIEKRYLGKEGVFTDDILTELKSNKEAYTKILDDPNIPAMTKYKVMWANEGIKPKFVSLPTEVKIEKSEKGFVLETYDEVGNKIESREVKNEKTALVLLSQLDPQMKENLVRNKAATLSPESKVAIDSELKAEGISEDLLFTSINRGVTERTVAEKAIMDIFNEKINKYSKKDADILEAKKKEAETKLTEDKKIEYSIDGKIIDSKELFLEEVSKYAGKEESPKIDVKNDEKAIQDVKDILTEKKGVKDALQEDKIIKEESLQKEKQAKQEKVITDKKIQDEKDKKEKIDIQAENKEVKTEGKTMAQADKMLNDIKLTIEMEPEPGTEKAFKKQAEEKVKKINKILDESKAQGHISPTQNKAIRTRIKNAVGGTKYQMKQAVEYAEKIVKDSEFRAQEEKKFKEIAQIKKEVKGLFDKKGKYTRVKDIFNVREASEVVDEYSKLTEADLLVMNHEDVSQILETVKTSKVELKEKAKVKLQVKQDQLQEWVDRASEVIKPIKKLKPAQEKYVEKDIKSKDVDIKYRPIKTFDTNLTSMFSRFAAKSPEPGKVGKDWLNKELYYGKMVPAERNYKKHLKESGDKLLNYVKKEYGKDARDVMNDMSTEMVDITIDIKQKDKITEETRKISKEEALKWYMLLQDPTLQSRIFEPMSLNEKQSVYKGNGFTDKTIAEIDAALTPKDKRLADFLFKEYQGARTRYNEFMKEKFGVNLPDNPKYSNIYSEYFDNYEGLNVEDMMKGNPVGTLKSNNIISRVANKNTIKDVGALSAYFDYMDKMEWMYQFSEPLEMYRGIFKNKQVRRLIEVSHGKESLKLIDDYEKVMIRDMANISEKSIDHLTKNFANAALGLNPNITVKQLFSTVAAMTEINPLQFTNELKNLSVDAAKAVSNKDNIVRELLGRDAITMRGDVGLGMDVFLSPYARKSKYPSKSILNSVTKLLDKGSKMYGKTIEFGDKGGAIIGGYTVYKTKYKGYLKEGLTEKDAKSQALKDFDRFIDATQQSMSMFNTSMTRFKSGSLGRAVTAFTSAPAQLTRLEMNMWRNVVTGVTTKGQFQNKEVLKNLARLAVIRQAIPALYQFAADGWEWDSDNQTATALLGNMQGIFALGKVVEKLKNKLQASPFEVSAMPILDNLQNLVTDVFDVADMTKYPYLYNDKQENDIIRRTSDHLGLAIGQPVRAVRNVLTGDIKNFFDGVKSDQEEIAEEAVNNNVPLESVIVDKYGADFLYDEDGKLRKSTRGYIEQYIYQVGKDKYGKHSNEIKKVMGMRKNDDIKKYLIRKGKYMDDGDFRLLMSFLSEDNDFGGNTTIRFISENMADEISSRVAQAK